MVTFKSGLDQDYKLPQTWEDHPNLQIATEFEENHNLNEILPNEMPLKYLLQVLGVYVRVTELSDCGFCH